ncbi:hypothetical protein [Mucilaginibacter frigoritolerans]|uniref:hypothetical protein n=1 Tax=Mucilaginibacter frigoritolerans TaxID=652788 RepID=UPI001476A667|nr:hypothetical protein [Mucilaginibacter frigoritolerans]
MNAGLSKKSKITPEKAVEILKSGGMIVTIEEAKNILYLLTILAKLEVKLYLKK